MPMTGESKSTALKNFEGRSPEGFKGADLSSVGVKAPLELGSGLFSAAD